MNAEPIAEMTSWRRDIHAHPEMGFSEHRTAEVVASRLESFGIAEVQRGVGGTGVVATLRAGTSSRAIGLRADMDALPIQELDDRPYRSTVDGVMHACGHDGHSAMLLGAARRLASTRSFDGVVHFIFQPAEESLGVVREGSDSRDGGALAMMRDGLFERFPMDAIFGLHNRPGLPAGALAIRHGVIYAAADRFEIVIEGRGGHAARPHLGIDPVVAAAHVVTALQTISSRSLDPSEPIVVSVCEIHGGTAFNIIPQSVRLTGTVRALNETARGRAEGLIGRIVQGVCASLGATAVVDYQVGYPVLVNDDDLVDLAHSVMTEVVGPEDVISLREPTMGGEDFACYLSAKPGCFAVIGNGTAGAHGVSLHNGGYDFNDDILGVGAAYWCGIAERFLASR